METDPIQIIVDLVLNFVLASIEAQYSVLFYLIKLLQSFGLFV